VKPLTILGIPGSIRRQSFNRSALHAAKGLLPEGVTLNIFELDGLPLFSEDHEKSPPTKVVEFKSRIRAADAILFATPEYNYSVSGVLKNAIDWASRPYGDSAWNAKPAAIMGASSGTLGTARAQYHLRQICVTLNLHVMNKPELMISGATGKFDASGTLTDAETIKRLREFLAELVNWAHRLTAPPK
jgi:chromate reductase